MLVLVREKRTETAVLGRLFIGSVCVAYTLENAAKAIPGGLYSLQNSRSTKFGRELPLIYGDKVPASRGVRIHAGNSYKDSSACLLVGMGRNGEKLTESKLAETMVTMLCRHIFALSIVDNT